MPSVLRSIFAVMLGFMVMMISVIVLTLIFVNTMGLKSAHPTPGYLAINVAYSFLAAAIGGFVTATFVRVKPIQHAAVLAGVIFVMAVISYQHYSGLQPRWYQAMMVVAPPLCAIAGAALYARNAPAMGR